MAEWNPRANELFGHAIQLTTVSERETYLERECGTDEDLKQAVAALIKAHEHAGSFLNAPHPAATCSYEPNEAAGTIIAGKYKLLQQIGEGGMGSVWMADQTEPVKRRVAVKLIRTDRSNSKTILARFEAERQAIALMDHPNIAKLLDAGTTGQTEPRTESRTEPRKSVSALAQPLTNVRGSEGSPYFVMELVKGVPLTEFCDDHKLTIPERLHLFIQICSAVQHANQKGIIHRDLKPNNILVEMHDDKPVPKVIDFGLAKATSGIQLTENTLFTGFGTVAGTPLYMAPEQAKFNAVDIDTRADIYALGAILYELLTGTTPITRETIKKAALDEMMRLIREQEAPTPSSRLSSSETKPIMAVNRHTAPQKLGRYVKGELDWIVMKALSKERDRRYETANGFAKDIERFLNHETVLAGPVSAGYRLRKFVRRNKESVIATSFVLLALLAGLAGTAWQAFRADQQRQIAEDNAQKALASAESEKKAKEAAEQREAETTAVLDFIENNVFDAARPKGFAKGFAYDMTLREAIEAALPFVNNGFADKPLIEARLRLKFGSMFTSVGEHKIAAEQYQAARTLFTKHYGLEHHDTIKSISDLAKSYAELGHKTDAIKLNEEVLAILKVKLGPDHRETLRSMMNMADSYAKLGSETDALNLFKETLQFRNES